VPTTRRAGTAFKAKTRIARERDAAERAAWRARLGDRDPATLLFLDETSTPLTLTRRRARAPKGDRAIGVVPARRWEAVTLVATLTLDGLGPAVQLPGALDRLAFDSFIREFLVPALHPGQTVLWDNLNVHQSATARTLIEAAGCEVLPLPRYSPDFNPIELAFSKLKSGLRRAEARTFDAVVEATGTVFHTFTRADCRGYFAACGYSPVRP
jgi:transposase